MPYYTPPGGAMTAAFARSLMLHTAALDGLGAVARSSPIAVRAAQSVALGRRSQRSGRSPSFVMTGMGMGVANGGAPRRRRRRSLFGLGKNTDGGTRISPRAMSVQPIMGIRHQPGSYFGPGGGPGSGPGWYPGYVMSGMGLGRLHLGQDDDDDDDSDTDFDFSSPAPILPSTTYGAPTAPDIFGSTLTAPGTIATPSSGPTSLIPTTPGSIDTSFEQNQTQLIAPSSTLSPYVAPGGEPTLVSVNPQTGAVTSTLQPAQATGLATQVSNLLTSIFGPSPAHPTQAAVASPSVNLSGVLPIALVGVIGIAALSMLGGKKRR